MTVSREIVGQFVDAAVLDPQLADSLLRKHPELKSATLLGESLLHFLAIENYPDGIRFLVNRGWPIDERDEDGTTPLINAVFVGVFEAAMVLLELGADPNAVSEIHDNPLHCAISAGNIKIVNLLLKGGATPLYTTSCGVTAFDVLPNNKPAKNTTIRAMLREHC